MAHGRHSLGTLASPPDHVVGFVTARDGWQLTTHMHTFPFQAGLLEGCVHVLSRHTTTALSINESEARLMDDVRQFLARLAPASDPYLHNDLHLRPAPDGWPGGWAAWAAQEPRNAHSHLLSMLLGNTLTLPVTGGKLALGTWQVGPGSWSGQGQKGEGMKCRARGSGAWA
ncbi:hypothetical protein TSOC_004690 [Tetrabaena socialis]|uniref:Secondary thiamine-phosphate synthase enzyme n=1 Tax=Tetrabaena socialis TaxID=47790 RepID=A0A2J8A8A8_9CHLO|nr:hypothetical protein TSOC_004690 [Tetrabaena socialis]|eukprot:PNH08748.1 hypothetical protein TSOC_004690 [Tetrabaena socialis]